MSVFLLTGLVKATEGFKNIFLTIFAIYGKELIILFAYATRTYFFLFSNEIICKNVLSIAVLTALHAEYGTGSW